MGNLYQISPNNRARKYHENVDDRCDPQQQMIFVRSEIEAYPRCCGQYGTNHEIALSATAEKRERIRDQTSYRLEIPCQTRPKEEGCIGLTADVQLVL